MSTATCCRHCLPGKCQTVPTIGDCHRGAHGSHWYDQHCPACAEVEPIFAEMRRRAAGYRNDEQALARTEPQNAAMRESRQFFRGAAEAIEWTLAGTACDEFTWISGDTA